MTAPKFVKPITCRRCAGKGYVSARVVYAGAPGGCYSCAGWGEVEGDKATLKAAREAREAQAAFRGAVMNYSIEALYGLNMLENNEPERAAKALASWQAGHPGLMPALLAHYKEALKSGA